MTDIIWTLTENTLSRYNADIKKGSKDDTKCNREWIAMVGNLKIASLTFIYGDGVNSDLGTISSCQMSSKFITKERWVRSGYTWRGDYKEAVANEDIPKKYIEDGWEKYKKKKGIMISSI